MLFFKRATKYFGRKKLVKNILFINKQERNVQYRSCIIDFFIYLIFLLLGTNETIFFLFLFENDQEYKHNANNIIFILA